MPESPPVTSAFLSFSLPVPWYERISSRGCSCIWLSWPGRGCCSGGCCSPLSAIPSPLRPRFGDDAGRLERRRPRVAPDDPEGLLAPCPQLARDAGLAKRELLRVGAIALDAHAAEDRPPGLHLHVDRDDAAARAVGDVHEGPLHRQAEATAAELAHGRLLLERRLLARVAALRPYAVELADVDLLPAVDLDLLGLAHLTVGVLASQVVLLLDTGGPGLRRLEGDLAGV